MYGDVGGVLRYQILLHSITEIVYLIHLFLIVRRCTYSYHREELDELGQLGGSTKLFKLP
jgi:hypothetical protein